MSSLVITKESGNLFKFELDGGTPIRNDQNRLLTNGDYCNFKTANGASIVQKQNILYSEVTLIASGTFTFASVTDLWDKLQEVGFFDGLASGGGGGGFDTFIELLDTPASYIGDDGKVLVVNESEQKVIFQAIALFTPELLTKLENIQAGAEVNVQADWDESNPLSDAFIQNKPNLSATGTFVARFSGIGQTYDLPANAVAIFATINDAIQHIEQTGFESDLNTFTQSGVTVTFKKSITTGQRIYIYYYI